MEEGEPGGAGPGGRTSPAGAEGWHGVGEGQAGGRSGPSADRGAGPYWLQEPWWVWEEDTRTASKPCGFLTVRQGLSWKVKEKEQDLGLCPRARCATKAQAREVAEQTDIKENGK